MAARRSKSRGGGAVYPHISYLVSLKPSRMNMSLDAISAVLARLGNPEKRYPSVLVAGTNGKGSVTTYVSSVLRAAGLRVGTYYSPHIFRFHERVRVDGEEISSRELNELVGRVRARSRDVPLTYFELLTAVAALHFLERRVDVAVFEVGLGGRLDATNLVEAAVTVITGISNDHRDRLGRTKARILGEKLGIVRAGVPLVANLSPRGLAARAEAHCARCGAPYHPVQEEAWSSVRRIEPSRMLVRLRTVRRDYGELETRMIGAAQAANVATAVRTIETLVERKLIRAVRAEDLRRGIARAFLAGRFQAVSRDPAVFLDVSHNEESLCAALETLRRLSEPGRSVIVFAALAHKELGRFPARAVAAARTVVLARLGGARSAPAAILRAPFDRARFASPGRAAEVRSARGVGEAIRAARRLARADDTILVMGSHVTVEEAAPYI